MLVYSGNIGCRDLLAPRWGYVVIHPLEVGDGLWRTQRLSIFARL
jgi:hypothetical protein